MVGSYILLIKLTEEKEIAVGGWQSIPFRDGYYAYVGSAMGGLQARIKRHLKRDKKLHWQRWPRPAVVRTLSNARLRIQRSY